MWFALALSACSLGPRPAACTLDQDCRLAFGFGSTCSAEGFCGQAAEQARCTATWPDDLLTNGAAYGDAFVVGTLFRDGPDVPQIQSAQLAIKQLGSEPDGLLGRPVGIVHCDVAERPELDALDIQEAVRSMGRYLVDELGVPAIIGPSSSDSTLAAYEELVGAADSEVGPIIISPSATSPLLSAADGETHDDLHPGLLWRTVPPDDLQGFAIASDIASAGHDEIAIVNQEGAYGGELARVVIEEFDGDSSQFTFTDANGRAVAIVDAAATTADVVVFFSSEIEDIIAFLDAAATLPAFTDPPRKQIFLADGGADPFLFDNASAGARALFDQIRGTRPQVPAGPILDLFKVSYAGEYNGEDPSDAVFAPYTYDATWLVLYGAVWSELSWGQIDGLGIAQGIRQATRPDALESFPVQNDSWNDVRDTFVAQMPVDVDGASGPLDFDRATGEVANPVEVWVILDDEFVPEKVCDAAGNCSTL